MKKIFALLLAAVLAFSLFSCANNTPGKSADGDTVTECVTDDKGNVLEEKESDKDGNLIKETKNTYDDNGKLSVSTVTKYEDGKVVKEESTYFSGDTQTLKEKKFTYNDDGTVLQENSENGLKISENVKSSDGKLVSSTAFNDEGSIKSSYDGENIIKSESFDTEGKLVGYSDFTYDESGKASGSETFNGNGETILKSVYEYKEGTDKKSKILIYNPDGTLYQTGVYDENGKLTLYDAEGNPVK